MSDNKIQNIADEITAYKPYTLFSLMEKSLKENNAPFPEEIEYYLKKMIKSIGISINSLNISDVVKNDNKYTFTINTQPFSYLEINDVPQNIKENTSITVEANIDEENPFPYVKFLWAPKNKKLPEGYQKPEDSEYLKNCTNNFILNKDDVHINDVEVGYLLSRSIFSTFFPTNKPYVSIPNEDISKIKINNLAPNKKYDIKGFKFTADENGEAIISEATRVAEKFNELVTSVPVAFDYDGKFKDHIDTATYAYIPVAMNHSKDSLPSVFYQGYFLYDKL